MCNWCAFDNVQFFAGATGGAMIILGLVGATVTGMIVDKYKRFEEVIKGCFCLAALGSCAFPIVSRFPNMGIVIAIVLAIFGFLGFGIYPVGLELGVEVTYPVSEATSTGIIIMIGLIFKHLSVFSNAFYYCILLMHRSLTYCCRQIQGIIYIILMRALSQPATAYQLLREKCTGDDALAVPVLNWTCQLFLLRSPMAPALPTGWYLTFSKLHCAVCILDSLIMWNVCTCSLAVAGTLFFWPTYKRLKIEQTNRQINTDNNYRTF